MRIMNSGYEIVVFNPEEDVKCIERAARLCYKSEAGIKDGSAEKIIKLLIDKSHEAMLEHSRLSVIFTVDRGVSHEMVRHRICSFAQESTRYCVAGDTLLTYSNPHVRMTLSELFDNKTESKNGAWKRLQIRQYDEETGLLTYAAPSGVYYMGEKKCIRILTELGYELVCTPDHEILTPHGYVQAGELDEGDQVFVNGTTALYKNYDWLYHQNIELNKTFVEIGEEYGFNVNTLKKWARILGIPKKGTGYFHVGHSPWNKGITDERQAEALRKYHHSGRRKEGYMKKNAMKYQRHKKEICEVCGATEEDIGGTPLQVHHKDGDRMNNYPDNLLTVCPSCHQRIHEKSLLVAHPDTIVDISSVGYRPVYDLEMNSINHNFVANGIVVHNCNYSQDKFGNEITVIEPVFYKDIPEERKQTIRDLMDGKIQDIPAEFGITDLDRRYANWYTDCEMAESGYFKLLKLGSTPQDARSVLPNSLKTEIMVTTNYREWRQIFKLRTAPDAHPQIREVMQSLLDYVKTKVPVIFDDI